MDSARYNQIRIVSLIPGLIFLIPSFSLAVRRYRDAGLRAIYAYVIHGGSLVASLAFDALPFEMMRSYFALSFIAMILSLIEFVIVLRPSYDAEKSRGRHGCCGSWTRVQAFLETICAVQGPQQSLRILVDGNVASGY